MTAADRLEVAGLLLKTAARVDRLLRRNLLAPIKPTGGEFPSPGNIVARNELSHLQLRYKRLTGSANNQPGASTPSRLAETIKGKHTFDVALSEPLREYRALHGPFSGDELQYGIKDRMGDNWSKWKALRHKFPGRSFSTFDTQKVPLP